MDIVYSLEELPAVAARLLSETGSPCVIALHGPMGAGKTTFTHAFCSALGVVGNVSSPTFALVNEYRTRAGAGVYHMDWYRLRDEEEALRAGMEEYLYSGKTCLVEWPERAPGLLPEGTVHAWLEVLDPATRRLRVTC
jgi:tRNA threonylcarbamoyladenosine biosynthesis protein TsaE